MVRVVLKRVSVTLIDGSVLSMDSPSSECHRPIWKDSKCTNISVTNSISCKRRSVLRCLPFLWRKICLTFPEDGAGQRESGDARAKVVAAARGNKDNTCGAPGGGNTGHVFNQRQQNAFIKPITGKSCGAEPHSHFHYRLSGDSHLHLTLCFFSPSSRSWPRPSLSPASLFDLLDASLLICHATTTVFANTSLLSAYFACEYLQVHLQVLLHFTLKEKGLRDECSLTLKDLQGWNL